MSNSTHDGHRKRLRAKFLSAPETLEDHELLELLLFYSIPRANTNEIAHRLLSRFGSIKGVVNAGLPALKEIDGIGECRALPQSSIRIHRALRALEGRALCTAHLARRAWRVSALALRRLRQRGCIFAFV